MNSILRIAALLMTGSLALAMGSAQAQAQTARKDKAAAPTRNAKASSASQTRRKPVPAEAVKALRLPAAASPDEPPSNAMEVALASESLRSGCAQPGQDIEAVLRSVQTTDDAMVQQVRQQWPELFQAPTADCMPFSLSLGERQRVTSFSLLKRDPIGQDHRLISLERNTAGGDLQMQTDQLPPNLMAHNKVDIALEQILSDRGRALAGALPASLERQVHYIARAFQERHKLSPSSLVRIVYEDTGDTVSAAGSPDSSTTPGAAQNDAGSGKTRLLGMRFFDREQVLDFGSAIWIDREDLPGGFFTTAGVDTERMFWSSPIDHVRISRGGRSFRYASTVRQTVRKGDKNVRVVRRVSGWAHHQGVDFAAPTGTPVYAVADGKVLMASFYGGYGNLIILEHAGGYTTYYAHLSAYANGLEVGSLVRRGDEIGAVGSTGRSTGPHLHFELRRNNVYIDPLAPGRRIDLWALRNQDQQQLARRSVVLGAITSPGAVADDASAGGARSAAADARPQDMPADMQASGDGSAPALPGPALNQGADPFLSTQTELRDSN
ncbi:MAG: M23 family metallopeptidase [Burkholderiaceae bacterium]